MPLDMPESVLVRFTGQMQPGITLRDLVNAIPYAAIQSGLLTVAKEGKKNIFSGRVLEIEGLPDLKVEQAFELSDASAERSAAGCTVRLSHRGPSSSCCASPGSTASSTRGGSSHGASARGGLADRHARACRWQPDQRPISALSS